VASSGSIRRLGGEEFGIVMPATTLVGAHQAAERLREAIGARSLADIDPDLSLAISAGVATIGGLA
jgi:PleD family two-component response regulator